LSASAKLLVINKTYHKKDFSFSIFGAPNLMALAQVRHALAQVHHA